MLLNQIGIYPKKVQNPKIKEIIDKSISIKENAKIFSYLKALEIRKKEKDCFIIAADTIVSRVGEIYNKPKNIFDVKDCLKNLSGRKHKVYGGICVISPSGKISKKLVISEVYFKRVSFDELSDVNLLKDGIGKAGGYAIQSLGCILIKKIKGSYSNIVGLSLFDSLNMLIGLGWKKTE